VKADYLGQRKSKLIVTREKAMPAIIKLPSSSEILFWPAGEKTSVTSKKEVKIKPLSPLCELERQWWKPLTRPKSPKIVNIETIILVLFLAQWIGAIVSCVFELSGR
jgi:hypothetical protein